MLQLETVKIAIRYDISTRLHTTHSTLPEVAIDLAIILTFTRKAARA